MTGEFLYYAIYIVQQLGVMLGVGAQTVLLCTHLVALHRSETENAQASYAHAARLALGTGFFLIILSGLGAVGVHLLAGQMEVLLAPAFLFKWALILGLLAAFFLQKRFPSSTIFYALVGGTWYALFLVHSLGPIASWEVLGALYTGWLFIFILLWTCFVALMRWRSVPVTAPVHTPARMSSATRPAPIPPAAPFIKPAAPVAPTPPLKVFTPPAPKPVVPPTPLMSAPIPKAPEPVAVTVAAPRTSWWRHLLLWLSKDAQPVPPVPVPAPIVASKIPAPVPTPPPAIKPFAPAPPIPAPVVPPVLPPAPVMLAPMHQPLSLEVAHTTPAVVAAPTPSPAEPKHTFLQEVIDHLHVPALRIMPQTAAEIGKQNRPPVVKLGDE